jgi:hypothetical protein
MRAFFFLLFALASTGGYGQADLGLKIQAVERCPANLASIDGATEVKLKTCFTVPAALGDGAIILLSGPIERVSSDQFAEFSQAYAPGSIVVLQSLGGDLVGGLRLGQTIRMRNMNTYIASGTDQTDLVEKKIKGKCFSACAYAFLGGVKRVVDPDAQYGVHQFRGKEKEIDAIQTQKLSAILGRYMDAMGVNRRLLDEAMLTDPGKVRLINTKQRQDWQVESTNSAYVGRLAKWRLEAAPGGKRLAFATQRQSKSTASITLAFAPLNGKLRGLLIVKPEASKENAPEWLDAFAQRTNVLFEVPGESGKESKRFQLSPVSNWVEAGKTNTPGTRQIWLATSPEFIEALEKGTQFWVKPLWQTMPVGLDEKTLFGTQGMKDALLAL